MNQSTISVRLAIVLAISIVAGVYLLGSLGLTSAFLNDAFACEEGCDDDRIEITICHWAGHDYVEMPITIDENGLHGHEDPHGPDAPYDIIPAPDEGCPEPDGVIVIEKVTDPEGSNELFKFSIDSDNEDHEFDFDDHEFDLFGGEEEVFEDLHDGHYEITESIPDNWELEVTCGGDHVGDWEYIEGGVIIDFEEGETTTCTFTNTYEDSSPPPVYECSDRLDNDDDGETDYPNDPGCTGPEDDDETDEVLSACSIVVVSDTDDIVVETGEHAVETWDDHSAWTAFLPDALWIWATELVEDPANEEITYTFEKEFGWYGDVSVDEAALGVASDNSYRVWLNGDLVGEDASENNFQSGTQDEYNVTGDIDYGTNVIKMEVTNWEGSSNPYANPAGALYRLDVSGYNCEDPRPDPQPTGVITYPVADGDVETGLITLMAEYTDPTPDGMDPVNWAVRAGTCAAGTNTVFGNVDGFNDSFTWDGSNFSSPFDTTQFEPGDYCFVFNPTDDPGENDVRETREFVIENGPNQECLVEGHKYDDEGTPLEGWEIGLDDGEGLIGSDLTDVDGYYCIEEGQTQIDPPSFNLDFQVIFDPIYRVGESMQEGWGPNRVEVNSVPTDYIVDSFFDIFVEIESIGGEEPPVVDFYNEYEEEEPPNGHLPECSDGIDNDQDGLIDEADPGCHTDGDPANPVSYIPDDDDETDPDDRGGGSGGAPGPAGYTSRFEDEDEGEVLGEATTCGVYLFEFIRLGRDNNPTEVMKLETFLNEFQGENLPVDGFYSQEDFEAVERFQVEHWENILAPWVPHGLSTAKTPTGYVYKTTMRWINVLKCPDLELELPVLP